MDTRLTKFRKSINENLPIVFCVKCGSTHLDQNSIDELRCYDCGNRMEWNAKRFSIARNKSLQDALNAFRNS